MDLSELEVPTTTRMELIRESDDKPTGVFITGHTPDSKQWRKAQREYAPKGQKNLTMRIQKKGGNEVDLPDDPNAYENRLKKLASVVTNIEGLNIGGQPFEYSPENVLTLFSNDKCAWMVDQWEDHMEDRANFLKPAEKPAQAGSSVSAGSTQETTATGSNSPISRHTVNG